MSLERLGEGLSKGIQDFERELEARLDALMRAEQWRLEAERRRTRVIELVAASLLVLSFVAVACLVQT